MKQSKNFLCGTKVPAKVLKLITHAETRMKLQKGPEGGLFTDKFILIVIA